MLAEKEWADSGQAASKPHFLAKRFAAKEAMAKAAGTGLRPPLSLTAMAVGHDALGKPVFEFEAGLAAWLRQNGMYRIHLSLSDERDMALAFVVIESGA
jgi:holo-[acyl-carrier protein] synthase